MSICKYLTYQARIHPPDCQIPLCSLSDYDRTLLTRPFVFELPVHTNIEDKIEGNNDTIVDLFVIYF